MKISFSKYQGTGNDFIIIDNRSLGWVPSLHHVEHLCHRHFGIGADGLMLLSENPGFDFAMTYYNSDGKESTMCGNGGRCITAFAHSLGIVDSHAGFIAIDGPHDADILSANQPEFQVRLKMKDTRIGHMMKDGILLDTGSPHFVSIRKNVAGMAVYHEGKILRNDPRFAPEGCNIDFLEILQKELFVRTFERGVEDETLSCGTGVTAAALVAAFLQPDNPGFYPVSTPGGKLLVTFQQEQNNFHDIWLEGAATLVFKGEVEINGEVAK